MKFGFAIGVLVTGCALAAPGFAASATPGAPASPARRAAAVVAPDSGVVRLGLAVDAQRRGDRRSVIEQLEPIDFTSAPRFEGADRAAFLLAQAYLALGESARFDALADAVGRWSVATAATRWIALERALRHAGHDADADSLLFAYAASGPLADDRNGATWIADAVGAMTRGADAGPLLERVPAGSRFDARARHLRGLLALEQGDDARGEALLATAFANDSMYDGRRELGLALAGHALERGRWDEAKRVMDEVDRDWTAQRQALLALRSGGPLEDAWAAWAASRDSSGALGVDAAAVLSRAAELADRLARDAASPLPEPGVLGSPAANASASPRVLPPTRERWDEVATSGRARGAARAELAYAEGALARETTALADRRRYLSLGLDSLRRADARMAPGQARLDSLRAELDALDGRLRDVRDAETQRVARRTAALLEACAQQSAWAHGLQHWYVAGPDSTRFHRSPAGMPSPAAALAAERDLTASLRTLVAQVSLAAPGWLARSYEQAWSPSLVGRVASQYDEIAQQRRWAAVLDRSLDSSLAAARGSEALRRLTVEVAWLERRADSLAGTDDALRAAVAREAIDLTLAGMAREREAIDYGRAASLYALAVNLGDANSNMAVARVSRPAPRDSAAGLDESEAPEATRRRAEALPALRAFLERHPGSAARGEMRFRLADLELSAARQQFRERMAAFVARPSRSGGVPVLDPSAALTLYRKILAEDRDFPHTDAVRFNAGMILADAGEPDAGRYFSDLVTNSPGSAYAQEAWLRMGDMAFDQKRFAESIERYEHSATGADPTLAAIAQYKRGWAHYNLDQFEPAADSFREVLDLYATRRADVHVEIEPEADAYLVHAIAGAGGAPAFARLFDRIGTRPYEQHVAMALGQQYRRHGRFTDAAAADQLVLDRWPEAPEALVAAQRQIETWQRAGHADRLRESRLALAPRFVRESAWAQHQASDSLRAAGDAFAHEAWLGVARAHHAKARQSGKPEDWRSARDAYATVLGRWPQDPQTGALQLAAGEASTQLAEWPAALDWYAGASRDRSDSIAATARVQRVAVTDAWYESTRRGGTAGSDSLAKAVLAAGDELLAHDADHARAADVTWRQSQLAIAHHWDERAVADLAHMVERFPSDRRTPLAATQNGEVLFRLQRYEDAGEAFGRALVVARAQHRDTLARAAERALPVCAYHAAEAAVAADSNAYARHANRFERVAALWPEYELSPLAQYRAGVAFGRAGKPREEVRVMQALLEGYPRCTFANDARLRIAQAWERLNEHEQAANAYLAFSRATPDRADAGTAWLKAADLMAAAGQQDRADELRLDYVRRHPDDVESAMSILEALARRDLVGVTAERPVSALLGTAKRAATKREAAPASHLARYLRLAAAHPKLASRDVIAQVRFLQGEEAHAAFTALRLTQPLARSVGPKKALLDTLLARYRSSADVGEALWAHAAAYRIGEALEGFADALRGSEAPPDLAGDDLAAYRNVLAERAGVFSSRGEEVWSELLRRLPADAQPDEWTKRARQSLDERLARRFLFKPEVDFPLVEAEGPERSSNVTTPSARSPEHDSTTGTAARALARRQGASR